MTLHAETTRMDRAEWLALGAAEYDRFVAQLETLEPGDWETQTECPAWTVRHMVAHVLGAAEGQASVRTFLGQARRASRLDRSMPQVDRLNEIQVADHGDRTPEELVARLRDVAPEAIQGRGRIPGLMRRASVEDPVSGRFKLGELYDFVYTRDTWMHRVDIARAAGRTVDLTADHDGVLVRHVAEQWADRHGRPVRLTLTGPAGTVLEQGSGGPVLEMDAVEFCRVMSGRAPGEGLLETKVPF